MPLSQQAFGGRVHLVPATAFKALEDRLIEEVATAAETVLARSSLALSLIVLAIVAAFAVSVAMTLYVIRHMLKSVRRISDAGDRLARGEENTEMPTENPAELGRIVWSINKFRESVALAKEREAENIKERQETERAARAEKEKRQLDEKKRAEAKEKVDLANDFEKGVKELERKYQESK